MIDSMADTRVAKKLGPRQAGALRWARQYGDALVCVRYRLSTDRRRRYTTVEILVDHAPTTASRDDAIIGIRVAPGEVALRERVKAAGGRWDAHSKLWRLPQRQVKTLLLTDRVVKK